MPAGKIAIDATGAKIGEKLLLQGEVAEDSRPACEFIAKGQVKLVKATIGRDLICQLAKFDMPRGDCLFADGITVERSTYLRNGLETNGFIRLMQASLNGGLYASNVYFQSGPDSGEPPFPAEAEEGSAAKDLGKDAVCGLYAPFATIGSRFRWREIKPCPGVQRDRRDRVWLCLFGAKIDEIEDDNNGWQPGDGPVDRFNIINCEYDSIAELTDDVGERLGQLDREYAILNARLFGSRTFKEYAVSLGRGAALPACAFLHSLWRSLWHDPIAYAQSVWHLLFKAPRPPGEIKGKTEETKGMDEAIRRFAPQPYLQLARIVRSGGFEASAVRILVRLEHNRTMYGDLGPFKFVGRLILCILLRYGYSPFRPLQILFVWFVISAAVFEIAFQTQMIVPAKDNEAQHQSASTENAKSGTFACPGANPRAQKAAIENAVASAPVKFNSLIFALETLVPLVDLDQKKNWTVIRISKGECDDLTLGSPKSYLSALSQPWRLVPDSWPAFFLLMNAFLGWTLGIFTAAGVSGLLRNSSDGK